MGPTSVTRIVEDIAASRPRAAEWVERGIQRDINVDGGDASASGSWSATCACVSGPTARHVANHQPVNTQIAGGMISHTSGSSESLVSRLRRVRKAGRVMYSLIRALRVLLSSREPERRIAAVTGVCEGGGR